MKVIPFVLLALFTPGASAHTRGEPLAWEPCDASVREHVDPGLHSRLRCAELHVPVDHGDPATARPIRVPAYRFLADASGPGEGTLLFLPGSPAQDPLVALGDFVHTLTTSDDDRRRLIERFDIVSLAPRGAGAITLDCDRTDPTTARHALLAPSDDQAWQAWTVESHRFVASCGEQARYIGTAQYVEDIEAFRQSLGNAPLHIYAHGYGTWVATWYGARFPALSGRLLLDGTIPFDQPQWMSQRGGGNIYPDRMLRSETIPAAQRGDFGLRPEMTASQIATTMRQWPLVLRRAWVGLLGHPEDLAAALTVADLWRTTSPAHLRERIATHGFHPSNAPVDSALRRRAGHLVGALEDQAFQARYSVDGATLATTCNDSSWTFTVEELRETERFDRSLFTLPDAERLVMGLPCRAWPYRHSVRPALEGMATRPPLLMLHDGTDAAHPWSALTGVIHALPSAHLVVDARRQAGPLLTDPIRQCSTLIAARYLLTGDVPSEAIRHCADDR